MTDIRDQAKLLRPMTAEERQAKQHAYLQQCAIAFPLTSDDDVLFYSMNDLVALEQAHGTDFSPMEKKVLSGDSQVIRDCLLLGLKRPAGNGKFARLEIDPEDLNLAHTESAKPILDALCQRYFSRSHTEMIAETEAKAEAQAEALRAAMADEETIK